MIAWLVWKRLGKNRKYFAFLLFTLFFKGAIIDIPDRLANESYLFLLLNPSYYVDDYRYYPYCSLVTGIGIILYHGWVYPYPSCNCDHSVSCENHR